MWPRVAIARRLFLSLQLNFWKFVQRIFRVSRNRPKALLISATNKIEQSMHNLSLHESQSPEGSSYLCNSIKVVIASQEGVFSRNRPKALLIYATEPHTVNTLLDHMQSQSPEGSSYLCNLADSYIDAVIDAQSQSPEGSSYLCN